jgi:hypothetical protein
MLFGLSILLLAGLFFTIDYNEFFRLGSRLSIEWILSLLAIQFVIMFLLALKWFIVVRRYGVSFWGVFQSSLIGLMVNSVTPVGLAGGEPVRAYVLGKIEDIKTEKAFATVLVDLFLNIVPVLFLNLMAIIFIFKYSLDLRFAWLLAILGLLVLALIAASSSMLRRHGPSLKLFKSILRLFKKISPIKDHVSRIESRVDELFWSFQRSIDTTMADVRTLSLGLGISALIWSLTIARMYLIFIALGVDVDFEVVLIVYAVLLMVGVLPLLPGALGIWEWVGAGLLTFFGIPLSASAAVVVIDRILFFWLPIVTGLLSSLHVGLNVKNLIDARD